LNGRHQVESFELFVGMFRRCDKFMLKTRYNSSDASSSAVLFLFDHQAARR